MREARGLRAGAAGEPARRGVTRCPSSIALPSRSAPERQRPGSDIHVPARHLVRVVLWMTGALLSFCAMAVSVRVLAGTLSVMEILALRAGLGLAVMATLAATRADLRATINSQHLPLHLFRNAVHVGSSFLWAMSLLLIPLGDDLRARVHHARVDAADRRPGPGRAVHSEPGRGRGVRPARRAGDPAPRPGRISARRAAGIDGRVRVCHHAGGNEKAHPHGQPLRDHLLDDAHPAAGSP